MRIGLVITELEVGGAEKSLTHLAIGLAGRGFSPAVYSLAPRPPVGRDQLVRKLEAAEIPIQFCGAQRPTQAWRAFFRLRRALTVQSPRVVQTFLFHANVIGALAAWSAGVAKVVAGVRVADRRRVRLAVERAVLSRVDRICCVSQGAAEVLSGTRPRLREKILIIPNGIDVAQIEAAAHQEPISQETSVSPRRALYVGRLDPQKGVDWLLETWRQAAPELPDWELVLVGDGPQRASLERTVAAWSQPPRVRFLGWRAEAPALMRQSHLLLLASRWEGMPNVILEAMALGLPVLATRAEGVVELLGPSSPQQTVPCGDRPAFLERLYHLAKNPSELEILGASNRERVSTVYSLDAMLDSYAELYRSLDTP